MTAPSDDVDLREPSSCEKLAAMQLRGDGLYTDASGSVFDADEYAEIRDAAKDEELADLRQQLATERAARERAERDLYAYKGRIADADVSIGNLQAAWRQMKAERDAAQQRLAAAESRLGKALELAHRWQACPVPTDIARQIGHDVLMVCAAELEAAMKGE